MNDDALYEWLLARVPDDDPWLQVDRDVAGVAFRAFATVEREHVLEVQSELQRLLPGVPLTVSPTVVGQRVYESARPARPGPQDPVTGRLIARLDIMGRPWSVLVALDQRGRPESFDVWVLPGDVRGIKRWMRRRHMRGCVWNSHFS